jgi:hypothetical protein
MFAWTGKLAKKLETRSIVCNKSHHEGNDVHICARQADWGGLRAAAWKHSAIAALLNCVTSTQIVAVLSLRSYLGDFLVVSGEDARGGTDLLRAVSSDAWKTIRQHCGINVVLRDLGERVRSCQIDHLLSSAKGL